MPRLDYLATLQDNVTPALARMADAVDGVGGAFSRAREGGGELTSSLSRAAEALRDGFSDVRDTLSTLVTLRVLIIAASLAWGLFAGGVRLGTGILLFGLRVAFKGTVGLTAALFRNRRAILGAIPALFRLSVTGYRAFGRNADRLADSILRVTTRLRRQGRLAVRVARHQHALALSARIAGRNFRRMGTALRAAAVAFALLSAKAVGIALLLAAVVVAGAAVIIWLKRLIAPLTTAEGRLAALSSVAEFFGNLVADIATTVFGGFVKGLLGDVLPSIRETWMEVKNFFIPWFQKGKEAIVEFAGDDVEQALETGKRLYRETKEGVLSLGDGLVEGGKAAVEFGQNIGTKLRQQLEPVTDKFNEFTSSLRRFSGAEIQSPFGNIEIPAVLLSDLNASLIAELRARRPELVAEGQANGLALAKAVSSGYGELAGLLPEAIRAQLGSVQQLLQGGSEAAAAGAAILAFVRNLRDPIFREALSAGELNAEQQRIVDNAEAGAQRLLELRKEFQERQTKIDMEAEAERAASRRRAAAGQIQAFLQASGQLVQGNQDLAIALATIDAGIAVAGAFAHGSQFGPVYQAAYVATTVAQLANTINSIRSLTPPAGIGGGSAPTVSDSVPQQAPQAPAQISLSIQSEQDTFSAATLRELVADINEAQSGQLTA